VITTEDVVEETSRSSAKVSADTSTLVSKTTRTQRVGLRREWLRRDFTAATNYVFSQGADSRSFCSIGKELIPSSASLRVLAERLAQEFAARPASWCARRSTSTASSGGSEIVTVPDVRISQR